MDGEFLMLQILILSMAALEKQPTPVMARRLSASADTEEPVELEVCSSAVTQWLPPRSQSGNELQTSWETAPETVRFHPERSVFNAAGVGDDRGPWNKYQCKSRS